MGIFALWLDLQWWLEIILRMTVLVEKELMSCMAPRVGMGNTGKVRLCKVYVSRCYIGVHWILPK